MSVTPGIVAFNPAAFVAQFPAFASVSTYNALASFSADSNILTQNSVASGALSVGDTVYDALAALPGGAAVVSMNSGPPVTYALNQEAVASQTSDRVIVSPALISNFGIACLMLNNSYASVVKDAPTRASLLNLLTAHITALLNGVNGAPPSGAVGRISGGTQGTISVQMDFKTMSEAAAFFVQTQWGAMFWQATAVFRTMRYVVPTCGRDESWAAWPQ